MLRCSRTLQAIATAVVVMASATEAHAQMGHDGRWLTRGGRPVYLVGFDCQELASDPSIDYVAALDAFVSHRVNRVRIWTYTWFGGPAFMAPWHFDESAGRYDLDRWNEDYWARLQDFVAEAQRRDIVVEVSIFAPYPNADWWWSDPDSRLAWNAENNVNGVFWANDRGVFYPQFFDLDLPDRSNSGRTLRDYQQALVDEVVARLGRFDNVFLEIANEFAVEDVGATAGGIHDVHGWQSHWAQRVADTSALPVSAHVQAISPYSYASVEGAQYFRDDPSIDVLSFRFNTSPDEISAHLHDLQDSGKVLSVNESSGTADFYADLDLQMHYAWGMLMSGGYFALYEDDSSRVGSAGWTAGAERLEVMRDIVESAPFWELSPVDGSGAEYDDLVHGGPAAGWQVLASPGRAYIVFFWGEATGSDVTMDMGSAPLDYAWRDPRDGSFLGEGRTDGSTGVVPGPASGFGDTTGIVLVLRDPAVPTDPPSALPDGGTSGSPDAGQSGRADGGPGVDPTGSATRPDGASSARLTGGCAIAEGRPCPGLVLLVGAALGVLRRRRR